MNTLKHDLEFTIEVFPFGWLLCAPPNRAGIPINALSDCLPLFGKNCVMDPGIAGALGGVVAVVSKRDREMWRKQITADLELQNIPRPNKWIRGVDCGSSSGTLFWALAEDYQTKCECVNRFRFREDAPKHTPADADDFGRCLRMIDYLCWRDRLEGARALSPEWDRIIYAWDDLCRLHKDGKFAELGNILKSIREQITVKQA